MKKCSKCYIYKDDIDFAKNKNSLDELYAQCRQCVSNYTKQYYKNNREERLGYQKQYQQNNNEKISEYTKQYCKENKEEKAQYDRQYRKKNAKKLKENSKKYCENNKEQIAKNKKQHYENNREELLGYAKQYQKNNKEKILEYQKEYKKEKRKNDPIYRLQDIVSASIYKTLKSNGGSKNGKSSAKYLPFTEQQLNDHIESLFSHPDSLATDGQVWMTWDNQGMYEVEKWNDADPSTWKWQLDHIIPHSSFRYNTMDCQEFRDCWALSNLRPYSAKQNIIDGNRR